MMPHTRAEARQRRLDARRRRDLPLWAAHENLLDQIAPLPSVEEIEGQMLSMEIGVRLLVLRLRCKALRSWTLHKALCARYLSWEECCRIEAEARRALPENPSYRADVWGNLTRSLGIRCSCDSCRGWWSLVDMGLLPGTPAVFRGRQGYKEPRVNKGG